MIKDRDEENDARRILVLLVLGDEVLHVGLGLGELHLIHALLGVPMQERLALEHGRELVAHALEQLLDCGRVAEERDGDLHPARRDVALRREHVVRDPLHEVGRILVLHVLHLFLDLLHRHLAAEDGGDGQVPAVPGVRGGHHVLRVEHLLSELGDGDGAVLRTAARREWREAGHEEVQTGEGD
jgi:hypothetical protein